MVLLLFVGILCIRRMKDLALAERFLAVLMWITFVVELVGTTNAYIKNNSQPVYHVFSPIQFVLICLYFNYSIRFFRQHNLGWFLGTLGVAFSVFNTAVLQKNTSINSHFLILEGAAIIVCCFISLHQILLDEEELPYRFANFWFTVCFCFFWGTTFTGWGMSSVLDNSSLTLNKLVIIILTISNYIYYGGLAATFFYYKKLIPSSA